MKKSLVVLVVLVASQANGQQVNGYIRRDGSYVQPHMRSAPDGNPFNNYSTQGNLNPYNGNAGHAYPSYAPAPAYNPQPNNLTQPNDLRNPSSLVSPSNAKIIGNFKSFGDYQAEAIARQPAPTPQVDNNNQIFLDAADQIDKECIAKRLQGVYKSHFATSSRCTSPQVIKLAQLMNIPTIERLRAALVYSEQVAIRIDKGELTEDEGFNLVNNYTPPN